MRPAHLGLLAGLLLGVVLAVGGIGAMLQVLLIGALGLAVGLVLEGRIDLRGVLGPWGR